MYPCSGGLPPHGHTGALELTEPTAVIDLNTLIHNVLALLLCLVVSVAALHGVRDLKAGDSSAGRAWIAVAAAILVGGIWYLAGAPDGAGVLLILVALLAAFASLRLRSRLYLAAGLAAGVVGLVLVTGLWAPVLHGLGGFFDFLVGV